MPPRKKRAMTASEMGKRGGASRMKQLTPEGRAALARKAAKARWAGKKKAAE